MTLETLQGDHDLLQRVLENLVENALRHAPRDSTIRIEDRRLPGEIELRVSDAGPGVPVDQRERIFDRFVQIDSPSQLVSRSGRGLGLTFCKAAVEAQLDPAVPRSVLRRRLERVARKIDHWQLTAARAAKAHRQRRLRELREAGVELRTAVRCPRWPRTTRSG